MKHEQRKSPVREPQSDADQQHAEGERRSPVSRPSGRKIDSLKIEPAIELHRSSSGRNIRLKHSKAASSPSPHGLTPRAPGYKKPPELARKRSVSAHETSLERDEDEEEQQRSRDRYRSLTPTATVAVAAAVAGAASPPSNQVGSVPKPRKSSTKRDDRRSSFMIPEQVLEQLGFVRSSTPEPEDRTNQENDEELEEKAPVPLRRIQEDVSSEAPPPPPPSPPPQQESHATNSGGGVYQFALWKKAKSNNRLVDAISGYDSAPSPTKPSPPKPSPLKRRSSSADHSAERHNISVSSNYEATRNASERPGSCRPRAQIDISSSIESLGGSVDQQLSITRSTSPVIGSGRTSLRSFALPPLLTSDDKAISRWRRGELIGEGTFGRVYMGLNAETGAQFALKEIEIRSVANEDQMGQLQKLSEEIEVMHSLRHDNIVRYKGSHRTENHFYIFMEYISGGSIASMLVQFDAFNEEIVRKFTRQIVDGVKYLHEQGIIHRDIKGANVLVTEHGVAKLADFGCSKRLPEISTTSLEESLRSIRGSIPWMAPEVVQQTGHTFKADIWSVGATVIEMATGKHPWPLITSGLAALYTIATTKTSPPIPEHLSDEAKSFLARCFCINPEERATAAELAQHPFLRWR